MKSSRHNVRLVDQIKHGDKVTIVKPNGQKVTGKAVMRSSVGGWVLNTGGAHGIPALADDDNIIRVSSIKGKEEPFPVQHSPKISQAQLIQMQRGAKKNKTVLTYPYRNRSTKLAKLDYDELPDELKDDLSDISMPSGEMYFDDPVDGWNRMTIEQRVWFLNGVTDFENIPEMKMKINTKYALLKGEPKEAPSVIINRIEREFKVKKDLESDNEKLISQIESNPTSEFIDERREQLRENKRELKDLTKGIKSNVKKLDKEQRKNLPQDIRDELRIFK